MAEALRYPLFACINTQTKGLVQKNTSLYFSLLSITLNEEKEVASKCLWPMEPPPPPPVRPICF